MTEELNLIKNLTPREIVSELDRHIIGQGAAKRAVAIALRNRWRRLKVDGEIKDEITPKNIIMMGPTGVGKTEIARRLAKLAEAPFIKVEASKFTEVGYVGKDVESMVRDLMETSINLVREREQERVRVKAESLAEERLLDLLLPPREETYQNPLATPEDIAKENASKSESDNATREKLRKLLREGKLDERKVEIDIQPKAPNFGGGIPMIEVISSGSSMDEVTGNLKDMFGGMFPQGKKNRTVKVPEALEMLLEDELQGLIDMEQVKVLAKELAENNGIIFIDEIDKIASSAGARAGNGEVSREGVQRDILPIIEGSTVSTKYGFVKTDHILFIAAGAFHVSKPSDLIPELQGRFPIRVELDSLTDDDFLKILTEPQNSLVKQYEALIATEGVELKFTDTALVEMANMAAKANDQMENIGARRLHTILETVMDELSFSATELGKKEFQVDEGYVQSCLSKIIQDQDLSRFIL